MANSPYTKTTPSMPAHIAAEIRNYNFGIFRSLHPESAEVVAALDAGRDAVTEYKKDFLGSVAAQFDQHGYITEKQAAAVLNHKPVIAFDPNRNPDSEYIGYRGEKLLETLKLNSIENYFVKYPKYASDDRKRVAYTFSDEKGNEVAYRSNPASLAKAMRDLVEGQAYRMLFQVSAHLERDGIKQTLLSYPTCMGEAEYKPAAKRPTVAVAPVTRIRHAATSKKNKVAS